MPCKINCITTVFNLSHFHCFKLLFLFLIFILLNLFLLCPLLFNLSHLYLLRQVHVYTNLREEKLSNIHLIIAA